jgi:BirA family biotin operon repressor/biotin-[acetyl-CoA-carboxylase] ligase
VNGESASALDAARVSAGVAGTPFEGRVHSLAVVDSTNDELRRLAAAGAADGTVVVAGQQTAGRGRRQREWHSAPGLGLYLSVLFRLPVVGQPVTRWTLAAAVAACTACRELTGVPIEIKWPNDLLHRGAKLGGILAELRTRGQTGSELVIGTGINVGHRARDLPAERVARATSLRLASCGRILEREAVATAYLWQLDSVTSELREGHWDDVAAEFERLAPACRGLQVRVRRGGPAGTREVRGVTAGLDPSGALLIREPHGETSVVRMADAVSPVEE